MNFPLRQHTRGLLVHLPTMTYAGFLLRMIAWVMVPAFLLKKIEAHWLAPGAAGILRWPLSYRRSDHVQPHR